MKETITTEICRCDICNSGVEVYTPIILRGLKWELCRNCAVQLQGILGFLKEKAAIDIQHSWLPEEQMEE